MLIVLEGLDGAGKSTQMAKLKEYIVNQGHSLKYLHFPRYDIPPYGALIAKFLRGDFGDIAHVHPQLVALLFALDRKEAGDQIKKWLLEGHCVLLDRYVYSNIAYQCSKLKDPAEKEALKRWILELEYEKYKIPRPDVNIFLDVPIGFVNAKLEQQRQGKDRAYLCGKRDIHEEHIEFQVEVRRQYLSLIAEDADFQRVDCGDENGGMLPAGEISKRVISHCGIN